MIKIQSEVFINHPPEEVFNYISNFENNPEWQSGMVSAKFTTDPPLRVGSKYIQEAKFFSRPVHSNFEVIAYEPGRMVKATSETGSFPITFTRIVEPKDGGSHITAIVEGDAGGFYKLAEPLLARMVKRSVDGDYANLKAILETPGL
jgi:uncharacterized membrane protein